MSGGSSWEAPVATRQQGVNPRCPAQGPPRGSPGNASRPDAALATAAPAPPWMKGFIKSGKCQPQ